MNDTPKRRRRGTGTLEDAGNGRVRLRLSTPAGRLSLGLASSREEGDALLAQARGELATGAHERALTLRGWAPRVFDRRELEGVAGVAGERGTWATHVENAAIASMPLVELRRGDVLAWLDVICAKRIQGAHARGHRRGKRLSRSRVQNTLNVLRLVLAAAVEREIVSVNVALGVRVPKRVSRTREPWTYLRADELGRLLTPRAELPERDRLWMQFAIGTGVREGEQFNLRLVDLVTVGDEPGFWVRYGSRDRGPKNTRGAESKIRWVPLFGLGLEAARAWLAMLPSYCPKNPLGLVFPGPTGARKNAGKHLHRTERPRLENGKLGKPRGVNPLPVYFVAAGIVRGEGEVSVTWHSFRHTCAAALVSGYWSPRRWSLAEVCALLGHESITTTERYAHLAQSALKQAAAETRAPSHKPAISPHPVAAQLPETRASIEESSWSHLRDLNSRPTVYEGLPLLKHSKHFDPLQARALVVPALVALGEGQPRLAAELLAGLAAQGDRAAGEALAAVAAGSWRPAIALLAESLELVDEQLARTARKGA